MGKWLWGGAAIIATVGATSMFWEPLAAEKAAAPSPKNYDVEIVRDEFGVPHINGKTDADAAYGLAFAHAEDDFSTIAAASLYFGVDATAVSALTHSSVICSSPNE